MDPNRRLLDSITRAHEVFLHDADPRVAFALLLGDLLALSESEYGFIGEVLTDPDGSPYLQTRAISDVAWNEETRQMLAESEVSGLEFYNLATLFGATIRTGDAVIANDPAQDPRRGGLPSGHPPLRAFMGLPLRVADRLVGMVGVANRPGGYDAALARFLEPMLATCGTLIGARRLEQARARAEAALLRRREIDEIVLQVSGLLVGSGSDTSDEDMERALGALAGFVGADRAVYMRASKDAKSVTRTHLWGRAIEPLPGTQIFQVRSGTDRIAWLMRTLANGKPLFVRDLREPPPEAGAELEQSVAVGVRSQAWLPAHSHGRVVGAIVLSWFDRVADVEASDFLGLGVLADLFASSQRRRWAEVALRRRREIDALALELSSRFLDLPIERIDAEIEAALGRVAGFVGADRAVLSQVADDPPRLVRSHVFGADRSAPPEDPDLVDIPIEVLPSAGPSAEPQRVVVAAVGTLPKGSLARAALERYGAHATALLTALENGRLAGAVVLYWRDPEAALDIEELAGLSVVADWLTAVVRRQQGELALRESEARFRVMADATPMLVWTTDARGVPTFANRASERFVGRPSAELVGVDPIVQLHPDDRATLNAAFERSSETRDSFECECRVLRADGEWRSLLVYGAPVVARDGTVGAFVGSGLDITDRQRLEEELRQAHKLEAVGRLAGGIAHDFNNLLTAVIGHVECARRTLAEGGLPLVDLDEIDAASNRAASLTRQLLAFARRQMIETRVVDTNRLVAGVEQLLRRLIGEHVLLEVALDPSAGCIRVDPGQLEQVLINLAVNARDAMLHGGRLRIETSRVDDPPRTRSAGSPGWVRIAVCDTGAGMDDETLAHAFEPFFTTKEVGKGTGLGLATCYGIVAQCHGQIAVRSEVGVGTTFEILLPVAEAPAEQTPASPHERSESAGHETILLVEDEPAVRKLAVRILRGLGYRVIDAADGTIAMRQAGAGPFDLLLTDMVMPGPSGPEVAAWARGVWPKIRVLYFSGYTDTLAGDIASERDFAFLAKPFTPQQLATRVRAALDTAFG